MDAQAAAAEALADVWDGSDEPGSEDGDAFREAIGSEMDGHERDATLAAIRSAMAASEDGDVSEPDDDEPAR